MFAPLLLMLALQAGAATPADRPPDPAAATASSSSGAAAGAPSQPDTSDLAKDMKDVTPPRVAHMANPKWPKNARSGKFSGTVLVGLIVDVQGNPTKVHIVRSVEADNIVSLDHAAALSLDQAALDAVSKYRFVPAKRNGNPIPVQLNVKVNFQLFSGA